MRLMHCEDGEIMSKLEQLIKELCPDGVEWKTLGEVSIIYGGLTGKSKVDFEKGDAKYISYKNIFSNIESRNSASDLSNFNKCIDGINKCSSQQFW